MAEASKAALDKNGLIENRCPCGCTLTDLDDYGYCRHLLGFSNDGKTYEAVGPMMRKGPDGPYDTGYKAVMARKKSEGPLRVPKDAILINPQVEMKDNGITFMAHIWVSARVYHKTPDKLVPSTEPETVEEENARLKKQLAALQPVA